MSNNGNTVSHGLRIDNVGVQIGTVRLLDSVSTTVAPGEHVAILGPSGAGKTTLLRAIAGLVPLTTGAIAHGDTVWSDIAGLHVAPQRRRIGMIAQDLALWPHLTARQHIKAALRWRGVPRNRRRELTTHMLERVELSHRATHKPAQLSGGEAQRLALARALAGETRLLLLDEPFGQLDVLLRERIIAQVREIVAELNATVLHVTHSPLEARAADRLWVFDQGRLIANATPKSLHDYAEKHPFVVSLAEAISPNTVVAATSH